MYPGAQNDAAYMTHQFQPSSTQQNLSNLQKYNRAQIQFTKPFGKEAEKARLRQ